MDKEKICPLTNGIWCKRDECAWYIMANDACAIVKIAHRLNSIDGSLKK